MTISRTLKVFFLTATFLSPLSSASTDLSDAAAAPSPAGAPTSAAAAAASMPSAASERNKIYTPEQVQTMIRAFRATPDTSGSTAWWLISKLTLGWLGSK